jgi:hypothetical protein
MGAQGTLDAAGNVFPFTYTWQRLTPDSSFLGGYRIDTVATRQVSRPSAASAFALAQSWLIRCVVQTSNAAGSASAVSPPRTLSPAPPLKLVNNTTDIRVTGIEVTQAVQEDTCSGCAGTLPKPKDVAPTARRLGIVVASTVPAVLTIAGARHPVSRKRSAITITIRRGHHTLRLKYSLRSSSGGVIPGVYVAAR